MVMMRCNIDSLYLIKFMLYHRKVCKQLLIAFQEANASLTQKWYRFVSDRVNRCVSDLTSFSLSVNPMWDRDQAVRSSRVDIILRTHNTVNV